MKPIATIDERGEVSHSAKSGVARAIAACDARDWPTIGTPLSVGFIDSLMVSVRHTAGARLCRIEAIAPTFEAFLFPGTTVVVIIMFAGALDVSRTVPWDQVEEFAATPWLSAVHIAVLVVVGGVLFEKMPAEATG